MVLIENEDLKVIASTIGAEGSENDPAKTVGESDEGEPGQAVDDEDEDEDEDEEKGDEEDEDEEETKDQEVI